jgi:hypothetical protein
LEIPASIQDYLDKGPFKVLFYNYHLITGH